MDGYPILDSIMEARVPFTAFEPDDDADWLDARRAGVGGSEVAAIMGVSRFEGPYGVWARKAGLVEPEDLSGNARVEWGNRLEEAVFDKLADSHPELLCEPNATHVTFTSRERPHALATLDGWAVPVGGGDPLAIEIKTAHFPASRGWEGGVPAHYLAQVTHYLSVTGFRRAIVAVLIDGCDYREFEVGRDEADVAAVEDAVDRFWGENVVAGVPPADVTPADAEAVLAANPVGEGVEPGTPELLERVEAYRAAQEAARGAREAERALKAELTAAIGHAGGLAFAEGTLLWRRGESMRFSAKALREADPELYESMRRPVRTSQLIWEEAR